MMSGALHRSSHNRSLGDSRGSMCVPVLPCLSPAVSLDGCGYPSVLPLTLSSAVPVLRLSLSPCSPARKPKGWARGKQLLLFFPSSRSNLTPTERSGPRGSAHPGLARPGCYHDDCWSGNVLSHLYSACWVAVPGSILRKAIPAWHSRVIGLLRTWTDRQRHRKTDQVRGTHTD